MKDFQQLVNNQVITKLHIDKAKLDEIGEMDAEHGVKALIQNEIITQPGMVDWVKNWWELPVSTPADIKLVKDDKSLITKEEYLAAYDQDPEIKEKIEGIYVKLKEIEFVVSKIHNQLSWFDAEKLSELKDVTTTVEQWVAVGDMAGLDNTNAIDAALQAPAVMAADAEAKEYASQFCTRNNGYLPSAGEMWAVYNNIEEIDELMKLIGGSGSNMGDVWLTSTQYDKDNIWAVNMKNGKVDKANKCANLHVKPFMKYEAKVVAVDPVKSQETDVKSNVENGGNAEITIPESPMVKDTVENTESTPTETKKSKTKSTKKA